MITASLADILNIDLPTIRIVDVGANPLTGRKGPYQPLVDRRLATIVGFEPDPAAFTKLEAIKGAGETYVPKAIGDGQTHTLRICRMSGMNSLLEPNFALLNLLHLHGPWAEVKSTLEVETSRLDDTAEVEAVDYLKIDIQGGELMVFEHGRSKLADCVVVHTEAMFVPMYEGQPLFSDQEIELRRHGLMVHKFAELAGHVLKPFKVNGDGHAPLSQVFWADVVFIKDITKAHLLSPEQLLKLATILHDIYRSYDVAHLVLAAYDQKQGSGLAEAYRSGITQRAPASSAG